MLPLFPKVEQLLKQYPEIKLHLINVDTQAEAPATYFNIFSVPAIVVTIDEKPYIKEAGIFSVQTLDEKIHQVFISFILLIIAKISKKYSLNLRSMR